MGWPNTAELLSKNYVVYYTANDDTNYKNRNKI